MLAAGPCGSGSWLTAELEPVVAKAGNDHSRRTRVPVHLLSARSMQGSTMPFRLLL
jgi:hypothetical protein